MTASEWDWTPRVFDHVQLNASDCTESVRFYETVLSPLGIPKLAEHEQGRWSSAWTDFTNLNVLDRRPPTTNLHICFYARSKEQVDAFHRAGVEAGFRSNGAPGYRDYAPGVTRLTCSTRMGTTLRPCTATSETSATVRVRRCTEARVTSLHAGPGEGPSSASEPMPALCRHHDCRGAGGTA